MENTIWIHIHHMEKPYGSIWCIWKNHMAPYTPGIWLHMAVMQPLIPIPIVHKHQEYNEEWIIEMWFLYDGVSQSWEPRKNMHVSIIGFRMRSYPYSSVGFWFDPVSISAAMMGLCCIDLGMCWKAYSNARGRGFWSAPALLGRCLVRRNCWDVVDISELRI